MKQKALFYVRVSTDEQAKFGYSIDMQQNQCFNFAEKSNLTCEQIFIDDGYTAKNTNRPNLKRMIEYTKRHKDIAAIIVWRLDRLCRNTDDYVQIFKPMFEKKGISILSVTENNDVNNPYGRYMRNLQINNAELESNLTSIRTIANLREKAKQGYYPGSIPPVGYVRKKIEKRNICVIDKEKAPFVKKIISLYATGMYSYRSLAAKMRSEGFMHKNKPCSTKLVENILSNNLLFYTGDFNFSGERYRGLHEPLISKELYMSIIKMRENKDNNKQVNHNFFYKGMLKCIKSGRVLTAEVQKGAHKSGEYVYYRCPSSCKYCDRNCKKVVKEEVLDDIVKTALLSITLTQDQYLGLKDDFKRLLKYQTEYDENKKIQVSAQITKLRNRINKLYDDKIDGIISDEVYFSKKATWENKLDELTIEYSALSKTNQELIRGLEKMSEPMKDLYQHYLSLEPEKRKKLLILLCPNLFYDGSNVDITIKSAFTALFKFAVFKNGAEDGIRTHAYRNHNPRS